MPTTRDERYRVQKGNIHYLIAGFLCVVGAVLMLTVAASPLGLPIFLIGMIWFAVARWNKRRQPVSRHRSRR